MGHIDADGANTDLIFTAGITGCTIIGVRNGGRLTFYHEPTRRDAPGQWLDGYRRRSTRSTTSTASTCSTLP